MAKAKFDIKTEATRPFYAYVGVADRTAEVVRESVSDLQKRLAEAQTEMQERWAQAQESVKDIDLEPGTLREKVTDRWTEGLEEAQERRARVEARMTELQEKAKTLPERFQAVLEENEVTYDQLVARGELFAKTSYGQNLLRLAKEAI